MQRKRKMGDKEGNVERTVNDKYNKEGKEEEE